MTTPALIRQSDLKRMGDFVKKNPGLRVEIEKDGVLIRVAPDVPALHKGAPVEAYKDFDL